MLDQKINDILNQRQQATRPLAQMLENTAIIVKKLQDLKAIISEENHLYDLKIQELLKNQENHLVYLTEKGSLLYQNISRTMHLFKKDAIHIGVSGVARVGKSTLLQTISGLSDIQIPTGATLPVTAVRSTIEYSEQEQLAEVLFHSEQSFLEDVIKPYHEQLNLKVFFKQLTEFQVYQYPSSDEVIKGMNEHIDKAMAIYARLLEIQKSLPSFQDFLDGQLRELSLNQLKPFVAYPSDRKSINRPYLAVKRVNIKCTFPQSQIKKIRLLDLPGLGDLGADIEAHHVNGLKDNIDLVLLVKRPLTGLGYWEKKDTETLDLLRKAKPTYIDMQDFIFIVINEGGTSKEQVKALMTDIDASFHDQKKFKILTADALDLKSVQRDLMHPILDHLSQILPQKDEKIIQYLHHEYEIIAKNIYQIYYEIYKNIEAHIPNSQNMLFLDRKKKTLMELLTADLFDLSRKYEKNSKTIFLEQHLEYYDVLNKISNDLKNILIDCDLKSEHWKGKAKHEYYLTKTTFIFSTNELNKIRVKISNQFENIDDYLKFRIDHFYTQIVQILKKQMRNLFYSEADLSDKPRESLELFLSHLETVNCPTIKSAFKSLLNVKLEFKSHFLPFSRAVLNILSPQYEDDKGQTKVQVMAVNEDHIDLLNQQITDLTRKAIYEYKKSLIDQRFTIDKVFFVVIEQFLDALVRDENANIEFFQIVSDLQDKIWSNQNVYENIHGTLKNILEIVQIKAS